MPPLLLCRKQAAPREVAHQISDTERPRRNGIASAHTVDQHAELLGSDAHHISHFVRETLAWAMTILGWREHCAQEQHEAVPGILLRMPLRKHRPR